MNTKDAIMYSLGMSDMITKGYLKDLSAADLLVRAVPGMNHIAWQLGHLVLTERNMLDQVKPGASPQLPPNFEEGHGRKQTEVDDASKYLATEDYIALMDAQRAATLEAVAEMDDAALGAPGPEGLRQMAPTVGGVFLLMCNHYLMHAGQYVAVRRKLGKPVTM